MRQRDGVEGDEVKDQVPGHRPSRRVAAEVVAASFLVLFLELALIRWLPAQVRVLAYFPNLVLIAAFLGLGIGALRAGRTPLLPFWLPTLLVVVGSVWALSGIVFTQKDATEHLWLLYHDLPKDALAVPDVRLPLVITFCLTAACFAPLGQFVGRRLQWFRDHSSALRGYAFDLLGSLGGVVAFGALSFAGTFPVVWFAVAALVGLGLLPRRLRLRGGIIAAVIVTVVAAAERADFYSPYYALSTYPTGHGHAVLTNGSFHQQALPLAADRRTDNPEIESVREGYRLPYTLLPEPPRRVLVLGAGTGNDVAVALDAGAERVDAVEIDPVILDLGRRLHPDRPYDSPRVRVINTDARSYLNDTSETYDLIVFGTLDSMTRLSALSSVRLDDFVYTRECLQAAGRRLTPDGGIVLYFMVGTDYIHHRLIGLLTSTFDAPPRVVREHRFLFNTIYVGGPAFRQGQPLSNAESNFVEHALPTLEIPTDDWPYLYLAGRGVSPFYASLLVVFVAIAAAGVLLSSGDLRRSVTGGVRFHGDMFAFGLGFLLLETKSVTEINLVWGATWLTSAVVFGTILAALLVATLLMEFRPLSWRTSIGALFASLALAYVFPTEALLGQDWTVKLAGSALFVGLPIFFAATSFALAFRDTEATDAAFGWNLLGAVVGGLLEFVSMAVGLKALYLVAAAAYLMAVLFRLRGSATTVPVPQTS